MSSRLGPFEVRSKALDTRVGSCVAFDRVAADSGGGQFSPWYPSLAAPVSPVPGSGSFSAGSEPLNLETPRQSELEEPVRSRRRRHGNVVYLFAPELPPSEDRQMYKNDHVAQEESGAPERNYDCENYSTCLGLAAALDWNSFTCRGCSGCLNTKLLWRAHQRVKDNKTLQKVCNLPVLS